MTAEHDPEPVLGETYSLDELPENEMNQSGNIEWVSDDTLALISDGTAYEFKMAAECTLIGEIGKNGEMRVIDEVK